MLKKYTKMYKSLPVQIKASFWFLVCSFLQRGISALTTPIFTRLLTTEEYGNFSVFNSWLNILTIFLTLNLSLGVYTQGLVKFEDERNVFSSSLQGITTVLTFAWLVVYLIGHNFWNRLFSLTTVQMLAMFVMIWSTAAFNFWSAEQRIDYRYRKLVITTAVVSIAKPVIGIVFVVLAEDKVTARILGLALVELLGYFWFFIAQMKKGKTFYSKKFWSYALRFNIPLIPHYLSSIVLNSSDRIMIKQMVSADAAGIYSLAYAISMIMLLFNTAFSQTMSPWMYKRIKNKTVTEIEPIMYLSLYMIAGLNLLCILVAPEIVAVFAPKAYYDAIWVIPPVAISVVFIFSYDFFARFEFYYEKTKFIMFASVFAALLNIALNYIFIRLFGYLAAGYTTLVCYAIYVLCHYICMKRICDVEFPGIRIYNPKKLLVFYGAVTVAGLGLMATYTYPVIRNAILSCIIIICIIKRKMLINKVQLILRLKKQ